LPHQTITTFQAATMDSLRVSTKLQSHL